ncbi:AraC family transcriptional regulator [Clostridium sp. 19966]|uniref:AraC family transcriptional regulator n=1 Tax=Clostridium sp. 19966 TaxID=2768166 RepID=UPI0028DE2EBF|nr:AraC family transcriptional regulator [Clostridium sp. 19966]MDT8717414.1 AraC family transcriptional regulator [Clostridium sp. 19966]
MNNNRSSHFMDLNFKLAFGNIIINILYINYESSVPNWNYGNHSHSGYELHFIPQGYGILNIMNKSYKIIPGTLYLTGPGVYHEQYADFANPMCEYCINFEFNVVNTKQNNNELYLKSEIDSILHILENTNFWFGKDIFESSALFEKVINELETKRIGYYLFIQNLVSQIILNSIRCFDQNKTSDYYIPRKVPDDLRRFVIDNYLEHCTSDSSLKELAKIINISVRQLNRIMKYYYSMSFKEKLIANRLQYASNLLINTNLSLQSIAEQSGFSSVSYFSRIFKKHYKISPGKFRSSNAS